VVIMRGSKALVLCMSRTLARSAAERLMLIGYLWRGGELVVSPQLRDRELWKHVEGSSRSPYFLNWL